MTVVPHGAYAEDSPFDVIQLDYAGSDPDNSLPFYAEVIQVKNCPSDHFPYVVHACRADVGLSYFVEVRSEDRARDLFRMLLTRGDFNKEDPSRGKIPDLPLIALMYGMRVTSWSERPWFYHMRYIS